MKKNIIHIVIISFLFSSSIMAQNPPGSILLEKFSIELFDLTCYSKTDFPLLTNALDALLADELGYAFCMIDCPLQPLPSCTAILLNGEEVVLNTNDAWCLQGILIFQWRCGPVPSDPIPTYPIYLIQEPFDQTSAQILEPIKIANTINTAFPNPSNGNLIISLEEYNPVSTDILIITNWSGKAIRRIRLNEEIIAGGEVNLNLWDQPSGVYFARMHPDHKFSKTIKIMIQK